MIIDPIVVRLSEGSSSDLASVFQVALALPHALGDDGRRRAALPKRETPAAATCARPRQAEGRREEGAVGEWRNGLLSIQSTSIVRE